MRSTWPTEKRNSGLLVILEAERTAEAYWRCGFVGREAQGRAGSHLEIISEDLDCCWFGRSDKRDDMEALSPYLRF